MHDRASQFRRLVQVSRQLLPRRPRRARLPRKVPPTGIEKDYAARIMPILVRAHAAVLRRVAPLIPALAAQAASATRRDDARLDGSFNEEMDALAREFAEVLRPAEIEATAAEAARRVEANEKAQSVAQVRAAFGVDVLAAEPNLAAKSSAFIGENVALIKSIPTQFFADVEKQVARAVARGSTPAELAKVIEDRYKVAADRARLIARDQVGKYFGQVAEARQRAMGVTHYIWRTSGDERVRDEHAAREGQRYAWDDPPEDGNPGEPIQCRCYAEPDLSNVLEGDDAEPVEAAPEEPTVEEVASPVEADEPVTLEPTPDVNLEAAREAHARETALRLAEQEIARAERIRAIEERARLLREAEASEIARREAEAARVQAEEAARRQAEDHARQIAEQEAARARAEAELAAQRAAAAEAERRAVIAEAQARAVTPIPPAVVTPLPPPTVQEWVALERTSDSTLGIKVTETDVTAALTPPRASGLTLKAETVETEPRLRVSATFERDGKEVGNITRSFGRDVDGTTWVKHEDFGLAPTEQGRGVGEAITKQSLDVWRKLGFDEVRLTATDAGRYTWAKLGFQWDEGTATQFERALPEFLSSRGVTLSPEKVAELARDPVALASLKYEGIAVGKDFLLSPLVPRWKGTLEL